ATGETANGRFAVDADGNWRFTANNAQLQHLAAGQSVTDTFTVTSVDGTASQQIAVTLTGINDAATISGTATGSVSEDGSLTTSGQLLVTDVDDQQSVMYAGTSYGTYGSLVVDEQGNWTYTLNNSASNVQALGFNDHMQDILNVHSVDGTQGIIVITVNGASELATAPVVYDGVDPNDYNMLGSNIFNTGGTINDDTLVGSNNSDIINALYGNDLIFGKGGEDIIKGKMGNDTIFGQLGNDAFINGGYGNDMIFGGSGDDLIYGSKGSDTIFGGSGNDRISGGSGFDTIIGGYGADRMYGGTGADTFKYLSAEDTGDTILDFKSVDGDKIDLSAINANLVINSDHPFTYGGDIGDTGLTAYSVGWYSSFDDIVVQFDTDGNVSTAEFQITLTGVHSLSSTDFVL
ncbi:MAG: VCBS domain-containing protein, partial [Magnetococcus sp. DMHC-6]